MSYETLMVHLTPGRGNDALLAVAKRLADKFEARVFGIAACQPTPIVYTDGYAPNALIQDDRAELDRALDVAEAEFRAAFATGGAKFEWQSATIFESIADYIANACHSADLILTSGTHPDANAPGPREKPGDIVLQSGRPVMIVPYDFKPMALDRVVVAWKNTREARRAIVDAIPLMQRASHVTLLEMAEAAERDASILRQTELCGWLQAHGVSAQASFVAHDAHGGSDFVQLEKAVGALDANVVVAGAYGHSRLREWALGGVTRELMRQQRRCVMFAH